MTDQEEIPENFLRHRYEEEARNTIQDLLPAVGQPVGVKQKPVEGNLDGAQVTKRR